VRVLSVGLKGIYSIVLASLPALGLAASSDDDHPKTISELTVDEIAMELSSPVTSLVALHNDFEFRSYQGNLSGAGDQSAMNYKFTPTLPIPLDNGKNILLRLTIPVNSNQPLYYVDHAEYPEFLIRQLADSLPTDREFIDGHDHLADIEFDIAYGGVSDNGFISMYGVSFAFPTSQDFSSAIDQYQAGPEVAFGKVTPWGVYGAKAKHMMRISGEDAWDTNMTSLQVFFAYGLGNGWQAISNPVIQYDWEGASDNKLLLPLGGGVSKTVRLGKMPLKMDLELQYYVVSPDALGPQWLLSFSLAPVFGNPFQN
jgi:hypothetical protein